MRIVTLLLMLSASLVSTTAAQAQASPPTVPPRTTTFSKALFGALYGTGAHIPLARVIFSHDEEKGLCVAVGTKRHPRQLSKNLFSFTRLTEGEDDRSRELLKLRFPKKAELEDEDLRVYRTCLDAPPRDDAAERDFIEILIREPRQPKNALFRVDYPPAGVRWGVDIRRLSDGSLVSDPYTAGG